MRSTLLAAVVGLLAAGARAGENWPEFRGPTGDGHARASGLA